MCLGCTGAEGMHRGAACSSPNAPLPWASFRRPSPRQALVSTCPPRSNANTYPEHRLRWILVHLLLHWPYLALICCFVDRPLGCKIGHFFGSMLTTDVNLINLQLMALRFMCGHSWALSPLRPPRTLWLEVAVPEKIRELGSLRNIQTGVNSFFFLFQKTLILNPPWLKLIPPSADLNIFWNFFQKCSYPHLIKRSWPFKLDTGLLRPAITDLMTNSQVVTVNSSNAWKSGSKINISSETLVSQKYVVLDLALVCLEQRVDDNFQLLSVEPENNPCVHVSCLPFISKNM